MKYSITLLTLFWTLLAVGQTTIGDFISSSSTTEHLESIAANFDLTSTLQDGQNLTVFAPSDDAVEAYASSIGQDIAVFLESNEALEMIQYHVALDQEILFSSIGDGLEFSTALGTTMEVSATNGVNLANATSIVTADVALDNGIVHLLDEVILPSMSIYDWIDASSSHNYVKIAIDNANLTETFDALDAMTFFAPNDAAFIDFADANDLTIYDILYSPDLSSILMEHLISESLAYASELLEDGSSTAASGNDLYVFMNASGAAQVNSVPILATDIMTHNGLIHSIAGIIQPIDLLSDVLQAQGLTLLDTLLTETGLSPAINFSGAEYTLFAPTDSAIINFMAEVGATLEDFLTDPDGLAEALLYHTTTGIAYASDLTDGMQITMNSSPDETTTVSFMGDSIFINESMVVAADIGVFQGLIHIIDHVLEQPESGCMDEMSCNFNEEAVLDDGSCYSIDASISSENIACLNGITGSISVDSVLFNQTDDLAFVLFDLDGNLLAENENGLFEGLSANLYFVSVEDGEECGQVFMIEITQPDGEALEIVASSTQNEDGTIEGSTTISGGLAPYSVEWYEASTLEIVDAMNLVNGTYIVSVIDANGCKVSEEITIDYASSIHSAERNSFRIYPNPTQGIIRLETALNGPVLLNVFNSSGSKVYEWSGFGSNLSIVDLSGFPNGFYSIQMIHRLSIEQQLLLKSDQ